MTSKRVSATTVPLLLILALLFSSGSAAASSDQHDIEATVFPDDGRLEILQEDQRSHPVPDDCSLVMAESSITDSGWGVFTLKPLTRGETIFGGRNGDVVLHFPDPNPLAAEGMKRLLWEYLWDSQEFGGQYEGQRVMSFAPGIGMLANGEASFFNVLPEKPSRDNAGLDRISSPGAGAITHFHNMNWKIQKDLDEGSEIFIHYGEGWFQERGYTNQPLPIARRSVSWLREHGYCLDNIVPGESGLKHAGRGAFARRDLKEGDEIAPVPVLPLTSESLKMAKEHERTGQVIVTEQLVRNYCFGQQNSSLLLYPYSPFINLINHASEGSPNVQLQWSKNSLLRFGSSKQELQESSSRLLLELVAIRDIQKGEEILLDYGAEWSHAWKEHIDRWQPPLDQAGYVSSEEMNKDESHAILRTAAELQSDPYPDNIFTSCYYRYSQELDQVNPEDPAQVFHWKMMPRLIEEPRYRRPCAVLDRHPVAATSTMEGEFLYTVRIFNRPGLAPLERIPKGRPYIVTGVPRYAIEFSDKLYTTDQHLVTAFRKEIGLQVFPRQWMDLVD